ncbi:YecA family protein [Psychrobacter frigidicola]|uniref:YecA family protein n=1 Tax=Psychrobacter frigidicola TaxID=45611 RepID=UPI001918DEBD|nr:SEC-C metal-binding domain-containing protein [Psychrobacter frigidicola]
MKLGRNEKCWCGSGLKFKRCHDGREEEKNVSLNDVMSHSKKKAKREECYVPQELHSECNKIINAHTVSKSSSLKEIADKNNHVLGLKIILTKGKPKLSVEKIGINNASTFKGFCAKHDKELFSSFEDSPFIGTEEQCFGLTFRAVAKELHAKKSFDTSFLKKMDKGKNSLFQTQLQKFAIAHEIGIQAAIKEISEFKSSLDDKILGKPYDSFNYLILESSHPIPIAVSSIVAPLSDFKGNHLQDLADLDITPEYLVFNAFSSNGKGFVLFSWPKSAKIVDIFIDSLLKLNNEHIFSALVRFFFSTAENSFISPAWWEGLGSVEKSKIESLIAVAVHPSKPIPTNVLVRDEINFTGWNVEKIYRVELS